MNQPPILCPRCGLEVARTDRYAAAPVLADDLADWPEQGGVALVHEACLTRNEKRHFNGLLRDHIGRNFYAVTAELLTDGTGYGNTNGTLILPALADALEEEGEVLMARIVRNADRLFAGYDEEKDSFVFGLIAKDYGPARGPYVDFIARAVRLANAHWRIAGSPYVLAPRERQETF
jgi:hypothetical protein